MQPIFRITLSFSDSLQTPKLECYIHNNINIRIMSQFEGGDKFCIHSYIKDTYSWRTNNDGCLQIHIDDVVFDKNNGYLLFTFQEIDPVKHEPICCSNCAFEFDQDTLL